MNLREKEEYLREYSVMKSEGKPFYPYAIAKDSIMAVITIAVIILMSLLLGAELGPKADATSTTYVPRPEWYYYFLFEVLRVIKPAVLTPVATVGVPTIAILLLVLLPFYDRNAERRPERRPVATAAGFLVIFAMGYLTWMGAASGSPNSVELDYPGKSEVPISEATWKQGEIVAAQSGCLACHKIGESGNGGPGPDLSEVGNKLPRAAILQTLNNPTAPMPSFADLPEEKKAPLVEFLSSLHGDGKSNSVGREQVQHRQAAAN